MTASNAGDIDIADINLLGVDADGGDDITSTFTLTASGTGSSVTVQNVTPATGTTLDSVVLASSDSGVVSFTASSNDLTITAIDGSGLAADSAVINVNDLAAATEITGGAGDITITTSDAGDTVTAGSGDTDIVVTAGDTSITLGSGADTVASLTDDGTEITGFDVSEDVIVLDISVLESNTFTSTSDLVSSVGISVTTALAITIEDETGGSDFTPTSGLILRLSGAHADTAAIEALLELDLQDSSTIVASDSIIVIWSDGANANIGLFEVDTITSGEVAAATFNGEIASLVGIDHTTLTAANFSLQD